MSKISQKVSEKSLKSIGDHHKYLSRITKTLYYGKLPKTDCLSLPVTELAADLFSEAQKGKSLERLHNNDAARISRNACVSPCSLVLALLYLERLKKFNPGYLERTAPSDLFLVSLMVSCKFLFDDGEQDEVFVDEWAASGGMTIKELIVLERDFLQAIDWNIYVGQLNFFKKLKEMETTLAAKQGCSRGHYTYTELETLAATIEIHNLIQCLVAVSVILAATYTAGFLTIVGSIFLASQVPGTSLYGRELEYKDKVEPPKITPNETDLNCKYAIRKVDAVDMLKTSIFLASIKTNLTDENIGRNDTNAQFITWDYWNVPIMNWLSKTSEIVGSYTIDLPIKLYTYFPEISMANMKHIELEDQIHKATKTRIQDQMESSWHVEWISSIEVGMTFKKFINNMKS